MINLLEVTFFDGYNFMIMTNFPILFTFERVAPADNKESTNVSVSCLSAAAVRTCLKEAYARLGCDGQRMEK